MKSHINLLPPDYQQHIKLGRLNSQIIGFGIWLILSLLIFITVLFVSFIFFKQKLSSSEENVAVQSKVLAEIRETSVRREVEIYNDNLKNFETLLNSRDNWSAILTEIAENLPQDLIIDGFILNRQDKKIELSGHGGSRNSVLQFRKNLIDTGNFSSINFPLANLEKPQDVSWKYRFYIK